MHSFLREKSQMRTYIILGVMLFMFGLFLPHLSFAQGDFGLQTVQDQGLALSGQPLNVTIVKLIRIILGFLGLIAVIIVLYGGYTYMTAGGNEDKIAKAKMILRNGLIGLAIILFSFIIVQFVLQKLSDATGLNSGNGNNDIGCTGLQCSSFGSCFSDHFAAISVTPSQEATGMNNIIVRAVFTKAVGTSVSDILTITRGGEDITKRFTFIFAEGTDKRVVEAVYGQPPEGKGCTEEGKTDAVDCMFVHDDYKVNVNANVVASDGQALESGIVCGTQSVDEVTFNVDQLRNDTIAPILNPLGVADPTIGLLYTEAVPQIFAGRSYPITGTLIDESGVGYVHIHIEADDDATDFIDTDLGPGKDVSADPYIFVHEQFFSDGITKKWNAPKQYTITATGWDIDHNSVVATSSFVLLGANCANDTVDQGEINLNEGGSCGTPTGGSCSSHSVCASQQCVDGQCVAYPKIINVNPMDGAPGNWVTLLGKYFGDTPGSVSFGSDENGWGEASLVQCPGVLNGDTWHDSFAIVEVPVQQSTGGTNGGIALDGDGYIELTPPALSNGQSFDAGWTSVMWIALNSVTSSSPQTVFLLGDSTTSLELQLTTAGRLLLIQTENGVVKASMEGNILPTPTAGSFSFLSIAERANGAKMVMVDGVQYIFSTSFPVLNFSGPSVIRLGNGENGNTPFHGVFDEVAVFPSYAMSSFVYSTLGPVASSQQSVAYRDAVLSLNPMWYWRLGDSNVNTITEYISGTDTGEGIGAGVTMLAPGLFGALDVPPTTVAIRLTNEYGYSDTTIDAHGPLPVYIDPVTKQAYPDGLFRYNDIKKPGLCAVVADGSQGDVPDGALAGPPGTRIRAHGTGFGDAQVSGDQLLFTIGSDLVSGEVFDWTEELVKTLVPIYVSPSTPLVSIKKGTAISNGIPFQVTKADLSDQKPFISDIDPADPTPGSFVTIYGAHFGVAGVVYLSKTKGATCVYGDDTDGCVELELPTEPCAHTWTDTQIIAEIDGSFDDFDTYYVTVERADNHLKSDGTLDVLSVQKGAPKPSICGLSPSQGPAPLPADHLGLTFVGKYFTATPILYFWNGTQPYSTTTEETDDLDGGAWIGWNGSGDTRWQVDGTETEIVSSIAYAGNQSMPLGKWPISIKANNIKGNSVAYLVTDCRVQDQNNPPVQGWQCCTEGRDTGSWKSFCEGEERESGYVWRFTTAIFPLDPYVLTQCDQKNWYDDFAYDGNINPSPIPSSEWEESEPMCLNAQVQVVFNMGIKGNTIPDNVFVYACGTEKDISCDYADSELLPNLDLMLEPGGNDPALVIKKGLLGDTPNFVPNTWYRVLLTTGVTSVSPDISTTATSTSPLRITRPLPKKEQDKFEKGTVAFYYDFHTGTGFCSLNSAFITPKEKEVNRLGLLMDKWYPDQPFYYYLKGKADKKCTILDVDKLGWKWSSDKPVNAIINNVPQSPEYIDTRAISTAFYHTPKGVQFTAEATSSSLKTAFPPDGVIKSSTSTLYINLGKPQVIYFEPNCNEACPNGIILVRFNRDMDTGTYMSGISVKECTDPNCIGLKSLDAGYDVDTSDTLQVKIKPKNNLKTDTYYKVILDGNIKSLDQIDLTSQDHESLQDFDWTFKVKADGTICSVDHVGVKPDPFVATFIGQKTKYTATPYTGPNVCSTTGQELKQGGYEYEWRSDSTPNVADITTFDSALSAVSSCTNTCLPAGSDISFGKKDTALCGNGLVEAGEDCDIGVKGEIVGQSCTLNCLRPGSSQTYCGVNGVKPEQGEMCNPTATTPGGASWSVYCTESCTLKGSSDAYNPLVSGYCGDGKLGLEEACDSAIPLGQGASSTSQIGCTNACLHTGTALSRQWCAEKGKTAGNPLLSQSEIDSACIGSYSACGNGVLEAGEQCERSGSGAVSSLFCSPICLFYDGNLSDNKNTGGQIGICGTAYEQCEAGTEGCTAWCTLAGSSLLYSTPSLCGDGVQGIGEALTVDASPMCELQTASVTTQLSVQLATAIGNAVIDVKKKTQETKIEAKMPKESKNGKVVVGYADYTLQCGFEEYKEPLYGFYNDCVIPFDSGIGANGLGVGLNSCCYPRPVRTDEYPVDHPGFENEEPVCRNTYIEVTFSSPVDPTTVQGNARIARGYETPNEDCTSHGGIDVTDEVSVALGFADGIADAHLEGGFWSNLWNTVKGFFRGLVHYVFAKDVSLKNIKTWCTEDVYLSTDITEPRTVMPLYISNLLGLDSSYTIYAVLLDGGNIGIHDTKGVGIKHPTNPSINDAWTFQVGREICKIDSVHVDPVSHLFTVANTSTEFITDAVTKKGQLIVPTLPYSWVWEWQPQLSAIFNIPADNASATNRITKLGSTNVEGSLTALARAIITADKSQENNQTNNIFTGSSELTSLFCEHPWPALNADGTWNPYTNDQYNFSFYYCADAGQSGVMTDDLPFLGDVGVSDTVGICQYDGQSCTSNADCTQVSKTNNTIFTDNSLGTAVPDKICYIDGSVLFKSIDTKSKDAFGNALWRADVYSCSTDSGCAASPQSFSDETGAYTYNVQKAEFSAMNNDEKGALLETATCQSVPKASQQCVGAKNILAEHTLSQSLLFSDISQDAVGVQIFENPNRLSASEWFADRFPGAEPLQQVAVAGYDAVANQDNYYVNALNVTKDTDGNVVSTYNNIYLFSLSIGSQASSRNVFTQILDTLEFNTNLTDHGYCIGYDGTSPDFQNSCTTDFDCILGPQTAVLGEEVVGQCSTVVSWQKMSLDTTSLPFIAFKQNSNEGVLATVDFFAKTTNGGRNWTSTGQTIGTNKTMLTDVAIAGDNTVWAITDSELWKKSGDSDWVQVSDLIPGKNGFRTIEFNGNIGLLGGMDNLTHAVLFATDDAGASWQNIFVGAASPEVMTDVSTVSNSSFIAVGYNGRILKVVYDTTRGEWSIDENITSGVSDHFYNVAFYGNTGIAVGVGGRVMRSIDAGLTWSLATTVDKDLTLSDVVFENANIVHVLGNGNILFSSPDAGVTWTEQGITQGDPSEIIQKLASPSEGNMLFALGNKGAVLLQNINNTNNACVTADQCAEGSSCVGGVAKDTVTYTSLGCNADKTKLARDWERLQDVRTIQSTLQSTLLEKGYPPLDKGTFRKNYVASVWPSWGSFGTTVGQNLPQDPLNTWEGCDPADPQTCWNADASTFICPQHSSVYEYAYDDLGSYTLHVPMEFFTDEVQAENLFSSAWIDDLVNTPFIVDPTSFTTVRSCTPGQVYTFSASFCGDGIVGPGEQCDPPGKVSVGNVGDIPKQIGHCEASPDRQCTDSVADCGSYITTKESDVVYVSGTGICTFDNSVDILTHGLFDVYESDATNGHYRAFGCSEDVDCANASLYGSGGGVQEGITNPVVYSRIEFEQRLSAQVTAGTTRCLALSPDSFTQDSCIGNVAGQEDLQCPYQQVANQACTATCQKEYGLCQNIGTCGNGIVEQPGEKCDDGGLNGQYGQCNTTCSALVDAYCGNGVVDKDNKENALEACEQVPELQAVYEFEGKKMRVASPQTRSLFSSEHNFIEALCGNNVVCKLFAGLLSIDINAQMDAITSASQFKTYCKNDTRLLCSVDADCFAPDDTHTFHIGTDSALTFVIDTLLTSDVTNYGPCVNVGGRLGTPYSPAKDFSCKWDCQGFGSYCGDGFTDVAYGEQCDDGNAIKGDGCNETCRTEAHCAYPDKSVACESDVMCPVSTVLSKTASIDPADRVCAYNNNVVFSDVSKRADYIHLFPCATDTQCQSGLAYGDETQIFTKDVVDTSPVEVSQALRTANKNLFTCKELQLLPTYEGFENTACVPDDLTPTQEQSVAPVQGAQCGNDIRDFDDKNGNKKRDAESFDDKNGNGKKDPGEVSIPAEPYIEECDISEPGTKTYDQCTGLGYNAPSCTYCSPQCTVITVESLAYCGNGIIDKIGTKSDGVTPIYETCDKKADGTVVGMDPEIVLQTISINSCQDVTAPNGTQFEKGTVDCNADCTLFQNQCFSCGLLENGPIARVSLLNPMKETDTPETGIFAVMVHLNDGIASQLGFTSFVGGTTDKDFNSNIGTVRIQTNLECSIDSCSGSNCSGDGYGVLFVNHLSTFGGNNIDDAPPHDVFEYPVNGEVSAVSHEFITSPAVPSGVVRIVIRTKHDAIPEQDELFGGFYQGSHSVPLWTPLVFNLFTCNAFSGDSSPYADGKGNKYLWPIASAQHPCSGIIDLYWPHPTLKGKEHTIQSFTLDLNMLPGDEPLAFFVQSLGTNAIGAFAISTDVWVDVYTAHDGQEKYSFFKPTYTFNIKTAVDGIAFPNKDAEFWHVFSIIPDAILLLGEQEIKEAVPGIDDLWLVPVEKMETDVCDLKDNIYPGHDYCNPGT